jgi:hypothetical protein
MIQNKSQELWCDAPGFVLIQSRLVSLSLDACGPLNTHGLAPLELSSSAPRDLLVYT